MKRSTTRQLIAAKKISRVPGEAVPSGGRSVALNDPLPWNRLGLRVLGLTAAALLPCLVLAAVLYRGPEPARLWWLSESGPVEMASGWGYVLLAVGLMTVGAVRMVRRREHVRVASDGSAMSPSPVAAWYPMLLGSCAAALAAREFDWHNIWTTQGVLKTRFYIDPAISLVEKLAAVAVLSLIGLVVGTTIRAYASQFLTQLRQGQSAACLAATALVLLPISKCLDSGPRILARFLPSDPTNVQRFLGSFEEIMELAIPVLLLIAATAAVWPRRSGETAVRGADQQEAAYQFRRVA